MDSVLNIDNWLFDILNKLKKQFGNRILFIGLQGSYNRGEATPTSDIDLIIVLDEVQFQDLKRYRNILDLMPHKDKACGFISGKEELKKWSKSDLFQFFYDTKPLMGNLNDIATPPLKEDIKQSIKTGSENIYHMASHSFLHSTNYFDDLKNFYKMTFFVLQAKYFLQTNSYIPTKKELIKVLSGMDKEILDVCINKDTILDMDKNEIEELYEKLIKWSRENI